MGFGVEMISRPPIDERIKIVESWLAVDSSSDRGGVHHAIDQDDDDDADDDDDLHLRLPSDYDDSSALVPCSRMSSTLRCIGLFLGCVFLGAILLRARAAAKAMPGVEHDEPETGYQSLVPCANDDRDRWKKNGECQTLNNLLYKEWLDARVTLADGIRYEIVGQIEHDKTAFT